MRSELKLLLLVVAASALAIAGNPVDQGSPGKQGGWPVANYPYTCGSSYQAVYQTDAGVLTVGVAPRRLYIVVCNSQDNTSGVIRCRADDGGVPLIDAGSIGTTLSIGDCVSYTNPVSKPVKCIGTGAYLETFECAP